MKCVYISARVQSRIESLKKSGKTGNALARKATRIIKKLLLGSDLYQLDSIGNFTKYGEKRIRNCHKYDMGGGFRLITIQRGSKLFIQFLGTHDECQRWLQKNSQLKEVPTGNGTFIRIPQKDHFVTHPENEDSEDILQNDEDEITSELSDRDLRRIFCGLIKVSRKQS